MRQVGRLRPGCGRGAAVVQVEITNAGQGLELQSAGKEGVRWPDAGDDGHPLLPAVWGLGRLVIEGAEDRGGFQGDRPGPLNKGRDTALFYDLR